MSCHTTAQAPAVDVQQRFALVGSPNSGKTTLYNALTGLHAKTGNYPGVTVTRYEGVHNTDGGKVIIEDLPGTYSLEPMSPDEAIVHKVLNDGYVDNPVSGLIVLLDATQLGRSLRFLGQVLQLNKPTTAVLTFTDELARRGGSIDPKALSRALGVNVIPIIGGDKRGTNALSAALADVSTWPAPPVLPPTERDELTGWADSILATSHYRAPDHDTRTRSIDRVLLHPVLGTLIFFAIMFAFFQIIFTVAAPFQDAVEGFFGWAGDLVREQIPIDWLANFTADAIFGGIGAVLVFLPQIALLFLLISLLEGSGYLSRAAFLMDRVMGAAGLEGRAFVALLSSLACAIPGIMATRTLPSAKDRIATIMGAPLMTCSARLPVYVLLIAMLVPDDLRWGPIGAQGAVMFGLYLLGAISAMVYAWIFSKILGGKNTSAPFYMEMPPYRRPRLKPVLIAVWDACKAFLKRVTSIILLVTVILWVMLNLPLRGEDEMAAAGVDVADDVAVQAYVMDNSIAADVGRAVSPVFDPLGFDWRINIGVLSSFAAREVFVATLGQVTAAADPEDPQGNLENLRHSEGPYQGELIFTPATIAALLVFFVYALQCAATLGIIRRETGTWKWSLIAFVTMSVSAWVMAWLTHTVVGALT